MHETSLGKIMGKPSSCFVSRMKMGEIYIVFDEEFDFQMKITNSGIQGLKRWKNIIQSRSAQSAGPGKKVPKGPGMMS